LKLAKAPHLKTGTGNPCTMQVIISMRPLRTAALIPVYCTSFNLGATLVEGSVIHPKVWLLPEKGRRVALNCANQGQGAV